MSIKTQDAVELDPWEARIMQIAQRTRYPATPDIASAWQRTSTAGESSKPASAMHRPRMAWAALAIVAILAASLAVTPIRAAIGNWLQLGAVWIQLASPADTIDLPTTENSADFTDLLDRMPPPITLAEAAREVPFTLYAPALLPQPDAVYYTRILEMDVVTLGWGSSDDTASALLQILGPGGWAQKFFPQEITNTLVNGAPAIWTTGPYLVLYPNDEIADRHLVRNHALIWQQESLTYRFESALAVEDAVRVAESLVPFSTESAE